MANLLVFGVSVLVPLVAIYVCRQKPRQAYPFPPGPRSTFFLGNARAQDDPPVHKELNGANIIVHCYSSMRH